MSPIGEKMHLSVRHVIPDTHNVKSKCGMTTRETYRLRKQINFVIHKVLACNKKRLHGLIDA